MARVPTPDDAKPRPARALTALYMGAIFLSALLLFQVQPIIGKQILPWFGGSAGVWTTCLLFFQGLLVLGYAYAHWTTQHLRPRRQALLHAALLVSGLLLLPVAPAAGWKPVGGEDPVLRIIGLLAASIGIPYFVLSTTGPLLQAWYARHFPGAVPYRLFSLSNLGSLLALLAYPLWIEPTLSIRQQSIVWSLGYAAFVVLGTALAWRLGRDRPAAAAVAPAAGTTPAPSAATIVLWLALAACTSILLMAVTSRLTQDIAPVPLLWVVPLCLYLLSFVLCFEGRSWYRRSIFLPALVLAFLVVCLYRIGELLEVGIGLAVGVYSALLFVACMVCHGELAALKPPAARLTLYYLTIAIGGALGGAFVAVAAPWLFDSNLEFPIGMTLTALLVLWVLARDGHARAVHRVRSGIGWLGIGGLTLAMVTTLARMQIKDADHSIELARDFYGALIVREEQSGAGIIRTLLHGRIVHGLQNLSDERRRWPTTYYAEESGIGVAIESTRSAAPQRVGVIGLGVGTLAAYGRAGDEYRLYEISPLVLRLARERFSYLADSPAQLEVVLGDARLSLEREPPQGFDVLAVDAFSGDAIPVHLLTREAFALYVRHLKPGGILAVHVSNRYLDLVPVVALAAGQVGLASRLVHSEHDDEHAVYTAKWVLVGEPRVLETGPIDEVSDDAVAGAHTRPWTDDYSSVFTLLRD